MLHSTRLVVASFLSVFALTALGCDCAGPVNPHGQSCTSSAQCSRGEICLNSRCSAPIDSGTLPDGGVDAAFVDAHVPQVVRVDVTPAMATLTSTDGSMPTQAFTATLVFDDGTMAPARGPAFTLDTRSTGEIDVATGTFTANGFVGGAANVTVMVPVGSMTFMGTASVTVNLVRNPVVTGTPTDAAARFMTATSTTDAMREAHLVYPLDGVVMPQNVYPADLQWTTAATGDLMRITMHKTHVSVTTYLADDGNHHWLADEASWRALAQTDPDETATIQVDRLDASHGDLVPGTPIHATFARAALTGSVYYWAIARGRIVRIDDGTATRNEFLPNPEQNCVGCHSVSPSGRYMVGRFGGGDNSGSVFDLTRDLTGNPAPTVFPARPTFWFSTWSPDETRVMVTYQDSSYPAPGGGGLLRLMDPMTGAYIDPPGLPQAATHPAWSPDGHTIAYVTNLPNGTWGGDYRTGDIATMPVTGPDTFGASTIIHRGADLAGAYPMGGGDAYPSWSPDSMHLAFAHGTGCRSESDQSALYWMAPDGSSVVRLDNASGGAMGNVSYQPRFSPFTQGGYYWLSFLTKRPYGNAQVGTAAVPGGRQQIWVAAIHTDPVTGDPSAVPYWLPGQDVASQNIAAYWAPRACRADGDSCEVGSECCGGTCTPDTMGHLVCSPPPPDHCRQYNETCSTDADCCSGMNLTCTNHVCSHPFG
jgi:hypothetical protein